MHLVLKPQQLFTQLINSYFILLIPLLLVFTESCQTSTQERHTTYYQNDSLEWEGEMIEKKKQESGVSMIRLVVLYYYISIVRIHSNTVKGMKIIVLFRVRNC